MSHEPEVQPAAQAPAPAVATTAPDERGPEGRAAAIVAGGLLTVLMLDAVVETLAAGSPIRWLLALFVVVYLAVTVVLRKRIAARAYASACFAVLLGLLAFSAWRPGGTSSGIVMLNLAPGSVLSALTGASVALAAWSLLRLPALPLAVRALFGMLAAYALVAIGVAIAAATPFAELMRGQSVWTRLPFWLQGAFLGGLVVVPAGLLAQLAGALGRRRGSTLMALASALSLAVAVAGFSRASGFSASAGQEGPGLRPLTVATLQLPVTRSVDLSHVSPGAFAEGLGRDPLRIFEFVRDQVAYEPYVGALRGPRGTLLAMAGNSVDRSLLLAEMLVRAGHRVRFVRGTLPDDRASALVASAWARRSRLSTPDAGQVPPEVDAAVKRLADAVRRDDRILRDGVAGAGVASPVAPVSVDAPLVEARDHCWVQWYKDKVWVDLDPSVAGAPPGVAYATGAAAMDALPDALFHRVDIRLTVEEFTANKAASRVVLQYSARSADLSGAHLLLTHGGATDGATVTPALLALGRRLAGAPFSLKAAQGGGGGASGFFSSLGIGQPAAGPVAASESLEFDFVAPGGRKASVTRELFDRVGAARRRKGETVDTARLAGPLGSATPAEFLATAYDVFITTGAVHFGHLANVTAPAASGGAPDVAAGLARLNVSFAALSDRLVGRLAFAAGGACRFYLASPRVQIAEYSVRGDTPRLSLDLRRDEVRAIASGFDAARVFHARMLRGVIDGTLERVLVEHLAASAGPSNAAWAPIVSTSSIFERAQASAATTTVLVPGKARPAEDVPADGRARIEAALDSGYVVVVPKAGVEVGGRPHVAWWQVDPRSGSTIAVTDEGLHQAVVEMGVIKEKDGTTTVFTAVRGTDVMKVSRFANNQQAVSFLQQMESRLMAELGNSIEFIEVQGGGAWWL
jgi:hypothetical protein